MTASFPPRDDLLATVRDYLANLRDTLPPEQRYQAQIATFLIDLVRREDRQPPRDTGIGDPAAFRVLIRAGQFDDREATVAEAILADVIAEMRVVRPDLLAPEDRE